MSTLHDEPPGIALEQKWRAISDFRNPAHKRALDAVFMGPYSQSSSHRTGVQKIALYGLYHAQPVYWSRQMCQLLTASAQTMPEWTLREEDLVVPNGFAWFAEEWHDSETLEDRVRNDPKLRQYMPHMAQGELRTCALSWVLLYATVVPYEKGDDPNPDLTDKIIPISARPGGKMTNVSTTRKRVHDTAVIQAVFWIRERKTGALLPGSWINIPVGSTLNDMQRQVEAMQAHEQQGGIVRDPLVLELEKAGAASGWDELYLQMRYLAASLALMAQRVVVTPAVNPDRNSRRRAAQYGFEGSPRDTPDPTGDVRVVLLRRAKSTSDEPADHREVAWTCQWLVRVHWRQQWYPSTKEYRPKLILPYWKGPEDAPIKVPGETLWKVAR